MSKYMSLGAAWETWDTPFCGDEHQQRLVLGGVIEMPDELAKGAIKAGASIIPETMFAEAGFTPGELKAYPTTKNHANAPAEFLEKHKAVHIAWHEYRAQLAL